MGSRRFFHGHYHHAFAAIESARGARASRSFRDGARRDETGVSVRFTRARRDDGVRGSPFPGSFMHMQ